MLVKVCGVSVIYSDGRLMNWLSVWFENWCSGSAAQSNDYQGNSIQSTTALCSMPLKPQRVERPHTSTCHPLIWKTTVVIYNRCAICHSCMFIDEWVCDIFQKLVKHTSHHKSVQKIQKFWFGETFNVLERSFLSKKKKFLWWQSWIFSSHYCSLQCHMILQKSF